MDETPLDKRDSFVKWQLGEREKEYTTLQNFKIYTGTWNVNGQSASESLTPWLAVDSVPPDIYAVGFQELDLSKEAFLFFDSPREPEWYEAVTKSLHPGARYKTVKKIRLVGMMLIVYVKESLSSFVHDVFAQSVGTGLMGTMGNKGGVAVSLKFHNTFVCFTNSHLAAHTHEYEKRNQDFKNINGRLLFYPDPYDPSRSFDIDNHDVIFWLGDLNYRIQETFGVEKVKSMIISRQFEQLLAHDQLRLSRAANKSFQGYKEGQIQFPPTYKYDTGTDDWDSSEKARAPAWCDRILWKSQPLSSRRTSRSSESEDEGLVRQLFYRSHPKLKLSDHKPVSAIFDVKVKVVDPKKRKKVYEEIMKHLDKLENEWLPQVECDALELDFGIVKFMESSVANLGITNTGQVPVQYSFINRLKPDSKELSKPWLKMRNASDIIMPGEKRFIEMEVFVDASTAGQLTRGKEIIDEILILHLENGRDIFITVSGTYQPSCFGCSLFALCHTLEPLKNLSHQQIKDLEKQAGSIDKGLDALTLVSEVESPVQNAYDIPKELWILVDYIYRHGLDRKDIFLETCEDPGDFVKVREFLDSYTPDKDPPSSEDALSVDAVANALVIFLDALPDPVIPFSLYDRCVENAHSEAEAAGIVEMLPPFHRSVFQYVVAFLKELLLHSKKNGLDRVIIATLFGGVLLRSPRPEQDNRPKMRLLANKKVQFLFHFFDGEIDDLQT